MILDHVAICTRCKHAKAEMDEIKRRAIVK